MKEICIKSVSDYLKEIEELPQKGSWLFRGHKSKEFKLIPSIGRKSFINNSIEKNEQILLKHFQDSVYPYLKLIPKDEWEWIALAQHYGLPTRLLDWSYNPLVALFFAIEEYFEEDSLVFAINNIDEINKEKENPFALTKVKRYTPPLISERINGQSGCFTIHPNPKLEFNPKQALKFIVPFDNRREIKKTLFKCGIRLRTIYPSIDGVARDLTWLKTYDY
jgi:hypothetical protein